MRPTGTTLTLKDLQRPPGWVWAHCTNLQAGCVHRRAVAIAPFVIRWGPDVSSDRLRAALKCGRCGHKGNVIQVPSWVDMETGFERFPVGQ